MKMACCSCSNGSLEKRMLNRSYSATGRTDIPSLDNARQRLGLRLSSTALGLEI